MASYRLSDGFGELRRVELAKEFCLEILLGKAFCGRWFGFFFGVGVDKVDGKARRDCRRFPILISEFASL